MRNNRKPDKRPDRHAQSEHFQVCGIHPVEEALNALPTQALCDAKLFIAETRDPKALDSILELCEQKQLTPITSNMAELNKKSGDTRHQGVILELPEFNYTELDEILENTSTHPLILVLDQIQDPHNLGAIIRSAAAFGVDGIIIPRDRAAQVNAACIKSSAGQAYHSRICRVSNIAQILRSLHEDGYHIVGADIDGRPENCIDYSRPTVLIMGSENQGMRRLTRTFCDETVRIAQNPSVESLNVSVAAAILLHTAAQQRDLPWAHKV